MMIMMWIMTRFPVVVINSVQVILILPVAMDREREPNPAGHMQVLLYTARWGQGLASSLSLSLSLTDSTTARRLARYDSCLRGCGPQPWKFREVGG